MQNLLKALLNFFKRAARSRRGDYGRGSEGSGREFERHSNATTQKTRGRYGDYRRTDENNN
jgi:hypothetical protein